MAWIAKVTKMVIVLQIIMFGIGIPIFMYLQVG